MRPPPDRDHETRAHLDAARKVTPNDALVHTGDAADQTVCSATAANFGHPIDG